MPSRRLLIPLLLLLAPLAAGTAPALAASGWSDAPPLREARQDAATVTLADGAVLAISGYSGSGEVASSELYDPARGTWRTVAAPPIPRHAATATVLRDGRVLLVGGWGSAGETASAELYDPQTERWSPTDALPAARRDHVAVLLEDGSVLVAGGRIAGGAITATAVRWDPATGRWSEAAAMAARRRLAVAARLADGRVLVAGGDADDAPYVHASTELYDPASDTWSSGPAMAAPHYGGNASTLPDGTVAVTGSGSGAVETVERFDPLGSRWLPGGSLPADGNLWVGAPLGDGRLLLVGDWTTETVVQDLAAGRSAASFALPELRMGASFVPLRDGRVLLAGGVTSTPTVVRTARASIFTPPTTRAATAADFGTIAVGATRERVVTARNSGGVPLWVDAVALAGPDAAAFAVVGDDCSGAALAPGASCGVRVRVTPTTVGETRAELTFDDNAEGSPVAPLTAAATPPPAPDPEPQPGGDGGGAPPPATPPAAPLQPPAGAPIAPALPAPPAGRLVERFTLRRNCLRPAADGSVRVELGLALTRPERLRLRLARAVGSRALRRCPRGGGSRRFHGRLAPVGGERRLAPLGTVNGERPRAPRAGAATVDARRALKLRVAPGLYRLTVSADLGGGRRSAPLHRWLRVLAR